MIIRVRRLVVHVNIGRRLFLFLRCCRRGPSVPTVRTHPNILGLFGLRRRLNRFHLVAFLQGVTLPSLQAGRVDQRIFLFRRLLLRRGRGTLPVNGRSLSLLRRLLLFCHRDCLLLRRSVGVSVDIDIDINVNIYVPVLCIAILVGITTGIRVNICVGFLLFLLLVDVRICIGIFVAALVPNCHTLRGLLCCFCHLRRLSF